MEAVAQHASIDTTLTIVEPASQSRSSARTTTNRMDPATGATLGISCAMETAFPLILFAFYPAPSPGSAPDA